jgi:hypothetical protein
VLVKILKKSRQITGLVALSTSVVNEMGRWLKYQTIFAWMDYRKLCKNLGHSIWFAGLDINLGPPKYDVGMIATLLWWMSEWMNRLVPS